MTVEISFEGLAAQATFFEQAPEIAATSARIALNDTAKGPGMALMRDAIQAQIAFPAGYLNNDKIFVSQPATNGSLEVHMRARFRPTSLARFAEPGQSVSNTRGKGVQVAVGADRGVLDMHSAFLVRLRSGASLTADNFNIGLAVRLKPGQRIFNKKEMSGVQLGHGLYLLYGPSVDQVFRGVAAEQSGPFLDLVESEFLRQFNFRIEAV